MTGDTRPCPRPKCSGEQTLEAEGTRQLGSHLQWWACNVCGLESREVVEQAEHPGQLTLG